MRYLCLIYLDESKLAAMPEKDMDELNARHLRLNEELVESGHFVEAEALQPAADATCVRVRNGKPTLTDGPYAETKETVAGFYVIEARDLNEAIQVAARLPSAPLGTVEVRPCRDLEVDGVAYKASRKSRGRTFRS
ncbi:MAG TPA: YciI family protein [Usitatibacter sp.]|nr:YciI family protein [Usitatibacter sp.]